MRNREILWIFFSNKKHILQVFFDRCRVLVYGRGKKEEWKEDVAKWRTLLRMIFFCTTPKPLRHWRHYRQICSVEKKRAVRRSGFVRSTAKEHHRSMSPGRKQMFIVSAVTRAATLSLSSWKRSSCRMWMPWYFFANMVGLPVPQKKRVWHGDSGTAQARAWNQPRGGKILFWHAVHRRRKRGAWIFQAQAAFADNHKKIRARLCARRMGQPVKAPACKRLCVGRYKSGGACHSIKNGRQAFWQIQKSLYVSDNRPQRQRYRLRRQNHGRKQPRKNTWTLRKTLFSKRDKTCLHSTWQRIQKADCLILCEGYMDVISLHQAGFWQRGGFSARRWHPIRRGLCADIRRTWWFATTATLRAKSDAARAWNIADGGA